MHVAMFNKIEFSCSRLRVPEDALIPLSKRDESKLNSLLKRPYLTSQPGWQNEVRDGECERAVKYEHCANNLFAKQSERNEGLYLKSITKD